MLFRTIFASEFTPILVGVSETGTRLSYGSGWDGLSFYSTPVVTDDGKVCFIFPSPDASVKFTPLIGANTTDILADKPTSTPLFSPYDEFSYSIAQSFQSSVTKEDFAWSNYRLFRGNNLFFTLRKSGNGPAVASIEFASSKNEASLFSGAFLNTSYNAPAAISGDAQTLAISEDDGTIHLLDDSLLEIPSDGLPKTEGKSLALSPNGKQIFYVETPKDASTICSWDRNTSSKTSIVEAILLDSSVSLSNPEIASARDTQCIAFVTNNNTLLEDTQTDYIRALGTQIVVAQLEEEGWKTEWCVQANRYLYNCVSPALSADGRFILFSARPSASAPRQIWRYDRRHKTLLQLTDANEDCMVPAISPSGRFAAFVTTAKNLGYRNPAGNANVCAVDMGPDLLVTDLNTTVPSVSGSITELPLVISGATEKTELKFYWEGKLPGTLRDVNKNPVPKYDETTKKTLSASLLPLLFTPSVSPSQNTLSICVEDGSFTCEASILITVRSPKAPILKHLSTAPSGNLFLKGNGSGLLDSDSFSMDESGTLVAFNTRVQDDTQPYDYLVIYLQNLTTGSMTLLVQDNNADLRHVKLSGDGQWVFYTREASLYKFNIATAKESKVADDIDTGDYAISYDSSKVAYVKSGVPCINVSGKEILLSEANGFSHSVISRDGLTAAFLSGNALFTCKTYSPTLTSIAENITSFAATLSATRFVIIQDGTVKWLASDGTTEEITLSSFPSGAPDGITISANGRFLAYRRTTRNIPQACRFDLLTGEEKYASLNYQAKPATSYVLQEMLLSADGSRLCFVSPAQNLLDGKQNEYGNELYQALFDDAEDTPATFTTTNFSVDESPEIILPLAFSDAEGNDAIPTHLTTETDLPAELIPYEKWYAVKICPTNPYFCGNTTLSIRLWDGKMLSSPQTFSLTVNNVNNPPVWSDSIPDNACNYTVSEGSETIGTTYSLYAIDPDMANQAPYNTEKLTYSLYNAPRWATLKGSTLHLAPDYDVTIRGQEAAVTFSIVVKDKKGEKASLPVSVTVTNTNRPPRITTFPQNLREGTPLQATTFTLEDDDPEDQDKLRITLKASNGSWLTAKGKKATFPRAPNDFPVTFQSDGTVVNTISASAYAIDGGNATSDTFNFTILLDKVEFRISDLWPSLGVGIIFILGEQESRSNSESWLMLATPYATSPSALASALGSDTLWIWQNDNYQPAPETLAPGQGFAVKIGTLRPDTTLTGQRTDPISIHSGWNLIGSCAAPDQTNKFYMLLNNNYIKLSSPPNVSPLENWAVWYFCKLNNM